MGLSDFEFLPYPTSMLVLTGISFATLLYVTYPGPVNKLPGQLKDQAVSLGASASILGASIQQRANKLITPVAEAVPVAQAVPEPAPTTAPAQNTGIISGITNTISSLNPFSSAPAAAPAAQPVKVGGSKKRRRNKSKKTKRTR